MKEYKIKTHSFTSYLLLSTLLVLASSCEIDSRVIIGNDIPPTFTLSGSGSLAMLKIHGQRVRDAPGDEAFIVWEITPKDGRFGGKQLWSLRSITYAKVPEGYVQVYPENGEAPPPLIEGQRYHFF